MQFKVNDGQKIPHGGPDPTSGVYVRRFLDPGEIVEGPPWWVDEFRGRMTPLDDAGNPIDDRALSAMSVDLATAKAHERVTILEDMIARHPGVVADGLKPELEKAKAEAESARADLEAKRATKGPAPQIGKARPAGPPATETT